MTFTQVNAEDVAQATQVRLRRRVWQGAHSYLESFEAIVTGVSQSQGRVADRPMDWPAGRTWGLVTLTLADGTRQHMHGSARVDVTSH
jgi:hypothetical protein